MAQDDSPKETKAEMVVYDFDPNNLPPDYLKAVGLVAMASAQTESVVGDFIGSLLGIDNIETLVLTTHMAGPLRDHISRALIEMKTNSSNVVDDVDDLLDAVEEAMKRRNVIVHNPLIMHPETKDVLSHRLKARGSIRLELRPISVKEIEEDARLIHEAGMNIVGFMMVRGLEPIIRTKPLMEYLDRSKKAREKRRVLRDSKRPAPEA